MHTPKILAALFSAASVVAAAAPARANCSRPVGYDATVTGNTVLVEPVGFNPRACPDADGMLRQSVETGDIVELADYCQPGVEVAAYVDECVPPGKYRYGFAKPYTCVSSACSTSYYVVATVTDALASDCMRSAGNAAPASVASAPWGDSATICNYQEHPCEVPGGDPGCDTGEKSSGCSVALTPGTGSVIGANLAALLAGLVWMRRRRNVAS